MMMSITWLLHVLVLFQFVPTFCSVSTRHLLSKPLIGDDGRIYVCSDKTFLAFETNGTIAWSIHVDYKCNVGMVPVHGGHGKVSHFLFKFSFEFGGSVIDLILLII
jgi:hypothetical protein